MFFLRFWDVFFMVLGCFWDAFGIVLGWFSDSFGVGPGSFGICLGMLWACFAHVLTHFCKKNTEFQKNYQINIEQMRSTQNFSANPMPHTKLPQVPYKA